MENVSPRHSRQHGAPTSLHANGMMSPGLPARSSLQHTAGKVPPISIATGSAEPAAWPKPKQPFLKRGAGVHKRINPAQQRRYVPKGGFVLQAEQQDDAHGKPPQAMADSRPKRLGKQAQTADSSPCPAISAEAAKPASASRDPWDAAPASVGMRLMQQQSASLQQQADRPQNRPQGGSSLGELQQQASHTHAVCDGATAGQHSDHVAHEEEGDLAELASDTAMVQIWGQKGCQAQVFPEHHANESGAAAPQKSHPSSWPDRWADGDAVGLSSRRQQQQPWSEEDWEAQTPGVPRNLSGEAGAHGLAEEEQSDGHVQQHVDWTSLQDEEALELEEFRALERQIIREAGPVLRVSQTLRQSQSHLQRGGSSRTMLPRQQGAPPPAAPADHLVHAGKQQPHGPGRGSGGSSVQSAQQGMRSSLQGKGQEGGQQYDVPAPSQPRGSIWQQAQQAVAGGLPMGQDVSGHAEGAGDGDQFDPAQDWADSSCADNSRPELHATGHAAGGSSAGPFVEAGPPQGLERVLQAAAGAQGLGSDAAAWEAISQAESQDATESTVGRQQQSADTTWAPRQRMPISNPASTSYIQGLFHSQQAKKDAARQQQAQEAAAGMQELTAQQADVQAEAARVQEERLRVGRLKQQLEQAVARLEGERAVWERQKADEAAQWAAEKEEDEQRLKRDRRVLDKQSRALLKLPNRKERSELEALEAVLQQERKAVAARDARHKLTVERLRRQVVELQERNTELREEVRFLEQRRLEEWAPPAGQQRSSSKPSAQRVGCAAASQPKSGSATPRTGSAAAAAAARSGGGLQHEQQASVRQAAASQTASAETAARQAAGRGSNAPAPSHAPKVQHSILPAGDGCNLSESDAAEAEAGYAFDAGQEGGWRDDDCDAPDFTAHQQGAEEMLYSHAPPITSLPSQQHRQRPSEAGMEGLAVSQAVAVRRRQGATWSACATSQSLKKWRAGAAVPGGLAAPDRGPAGVSPPHAAPRQPASQGRHIWPAAGAPQVDWEADAGDPEADPQPAAQGEPRLAGGGQAPDAAAMPATFSWQPLASGGGTRQRGQLPLRLQQPARSEHGAGAEAQPSSWAREQGRPAVAQQGSGYNERLEGPAGTRFQHAADEQAQTSQSGAHRRRQGPAAGGGGRSSGPAAGLGAEATLHTWAAADSGASYPQGQQQGGASADWPGLGQPASRAQEAQGQHPERGATDWPGLGQPDSRTHKPQNHDQEWASADWQGLGQSDRQSQQHEWAAALPCAAGPDAQAVGGWHGHSHASKPDAEVTGGLRRSDSPAAGVSAEQDSLWRQNGFVHKEQSQAADWQEAAAAGGQAAMQQARSWEQPPLQRSGADVPEGQADASAGGAGSAQPAKVVTHLDGKVERHFLDGRRTVTFSNGTCKEQLPDGRSAIHFTNGDMKKFYPSGLIEYYYKEVDTWHTTHPSGVEVFYFSTGQTEAHHPSGMKEIIFPDDVIRRVFPDGREQDVMPNQLSKAVQQVMPTPTF